MEPRLAPSVRVPALLLCLGKPPPRRTGSPVQPLVIGQSGSFPRSSCALANEVSRVQSVFPSNPGCDGVVSGRRGIGIKKSFHWEINY